MLASDLDEMVADLPASLVWTPSGEAEQTVSVTAAELESEEDLQMAGYLGNIDKMVVTAVDNFTSSVTPPIGATLTVDGTEYRVGNKSESQDGIGVNLFLVRV